jgi:hypothetical protein
MKRKILWAFGAFTISVVGIAITLIGLGKLDAHQTPNQSEGVRPQGNSVVTKASPADPCKRPNPLDPNYSQQDREADQKEYLRKTRGYPADVPLAQAVDQFNKEARCVPNGESQPPLTVVELLAAVRDVQLSEEGFSSSYLKVFRRISSEQIMPKGTLIWYEFGYQQPGGYDVDYWKIYIYVGLEKHPADEKWDKEYPPPKMKYLVRKQYISSEPSKLK